jgi:hypothetical protein
LAVAASAAIVLVAFLLIAIGWVGSLRSRTETYSVTGALKEVDLRLSSGRALIVGSSSSSLEVRRTDRYAFGHPATERRSLSNGVLRISSRCPRIVIGSCSASYELAVPETVRVNVQTTDGDVRLTGFRGSVSVTTGSGSVDAEAYCGFDLAAGSVSGNLHVAAACAPERLDLSTGGGDAIAQVPPGRYRISASSGAGKRRVTGVVQDPRAPFVISAHSASGTVVVAGGL